jgi:hypothetical protein
MLRGCHGSLNECRRANGSVAKARGEYVRTHFKNMREVAAAISGKLWFSGNPASFLYSDIWRLGYRHFALRQLTVDERNLTEMRRRAGARPAGMLDWYR